MYISLIMQLHSYPALIHCYEYVVVLQIKVEFLFFSFLTGTFFLMFQFLPFL